MKTLLYFSWKRNQKEYLANLIFPLILLGVVFVILTILDYLVPVLNYEYMRWPDMIKSIIGLPAWSKNLYGNVWQLICVFYPFYFIYTMMWGLTKAIIEEERLETVVYLRNLSIHRNTMLWTKFLIWTAQAFLSCFLLFIENAIFFLCLASKQMIISAFRYYMELFFVCIIYLAVGLFLASYHKREDACEYSMLGILFFPFLIARVPAMIGFLGDLLKITGRTGTVANGLLEIGKRLHALDILCPAIWCWQSSAISLLYIISGILITVILLGMGYFIYTGKR